MASDPADHGVDPLLKRDCLAGFLVAVGDFLNQLSAVGFAQHRRSRSHANRFRPEFIDNQSQRFKLIGDFEHCAPIRFLQFDDGRDKHRIGLRAALRLEPFQLFINQSFMRRVLVDDDDAVGRLRDDVIPVDLRLRRAQRKFLGFCILILLYLFPRRQVT